MSRISKHPNEEIVENKLYDIFINSIKNINQTEDVVSFLNDLLSPQEKVMLAKRIGVAYLLLQGKYTYDEIKKALRVSLGTIAKIHAVLALQGEGFRKTLQKIIFKKNVKNSLSELLEILTPLPPKGVSRGEWHKSRRQARWKREEPL
ncbi:hypothetical protein A2210_01020 [Candidatus Woesebacteria bacterium RIFOXYA1_FULL_40_18]|uniref:TrpR like protein, YerC/YecD n=5 Tax=Candidatus Woeseibacteriota TaxID=1752722 RepID=A0A0G0UV95_9BACT|nr:MAG: hypothetical protein UT72_C0009G0006 [Candidatus Woesebacteria bacterium GW2011_GWB1_40_101]KKR63570.1 MAG: hypothetical protein UU03_C0002G0006 [Candidatus Woesebacteria bacterium GW2011_GWA1_40_45]OGM77259.1 MAG: hypothetical protein A2210_01020 [Candidatus Woesebacteria bacterium RIFOXYA1_FULL_40_18]OGM81656.1 MAG: hypothetical protein A2361_01300 [Candidatus Woesebacteria bacterium RIFOXYB1_FULL_40_26]OGM88661.1 MAG: hypothetical protein A2614_01410 [Candidatus Woesebacteria bacteri